MATNTELRAQLAGAATAYIYAYLKLQELAANPASDAQDEWDADTSDTWFIEDLLVDAQDAQALINAVDQQVEAYNAILQENEDIMREAFLAFPVKEKLSTRSGIWTINYDAGTDTFTVNGLAPFTPGELPNLMLWFKAYDVMPGLVDTWYDKSGNDYNLTASGALRPTVAATDSPVTFAGAQGLVSPTLPLSTSQDSTLFVVLNNQSTGTVNLMEISSIFSSNSAFVIDLTEVSLSTMDVRVASNGDVGLDSTTLTGNSNERILVRAQILRSETKDTTLFINGDGTGATTVDVDNTNNLANFPLYLGSRNNASRFFTGDIYEFIYYTRALTTDEIASVEDYLRAKYSIA